MKPVNYFSSTEFKTATKTGFVSGVSAALMAALTNGFRLDVIVPSFISGFAGVFVLAKDQIKSNPNIYTAPMLPERNLDQAVLNAAKVEVESRAIQYVLTNQCDHLEQVKQDIAPQVLSELLPQKKQGLLPNLLKRLF